MRASSIIFSWSASRRETIPIDLACIFRPRAAALNGACPQRTTSHGLVSAFPRLSIHQPDAVVLFSSDYPPRDQKVFREHQSPGRPDIWNHGATTTVSSTVLFAHLCARACVRVCASAHAPLAPPAMSHSRGRSGLPDLELIDSLITILLCPPV